MDAILNVLVLGGCWNVNVFLSLLAGVMKYRWYLLGRMKGSSFPAPLTGVCLEAPTSKLRLSC